MSELQRTKENAEAGMIKFKMPQHYSALAFLGTRGNDPFDGCDYRNDGYVYDRDGNKIKRWNIRLDSRGDEIIWEPKLLNIAFLEARRWFFHERMMRIGTPLWETIYVKMKDAGHFCGWHKFSEKGQGWLHFNEFGTGIGWSWCRDGEERPPINQALTDAWFAYERHSERLSKPFWLYQRAFLRAVDFNYWKSFSEQEHAYRLTVLRLQVNGREYIFRRADSEYADRRFESVCFPEEVHHVEISV